MATKAQFIWPNTNLLTRLGDCATVGRAVISVVDAVSFRVDAYFEETQLASIREGDPVSIKLMGQGQIVRGEVDSLARGINVPNAQPNDQRLATVNPIFTWVCLAQRVPVRIRIVEVPEVTAGIGENACSIRAAVCGRMAWLGLELDRAANCANGPLISTRASKVRGIGIDTEPQRLYSFRATLEI